MLVLTIAHKKGGVGKTMLACQMAAHLASIGRRVLLVDATLQRHAALFRSLRSEEVPVLESVSITTATLHKDLPAVGASYDFVLIDVGGADSLTARSAVLAADRVLLPLRAGLTDAQDTAEFLDSLDELALGNAAGNNGTPWVFLAVNQVRPNTRLRAETLATVEELVAERPYARVLETQVGLREAFAQSFREGRAVTESAADPAAANELLLLMEELGLPTLAEAKEEVTS